MVRIVGAKESLVFPGHGQEEVGVVSLCAHCCVLAFQKFHQTVLFDGITLIDLPTGGVHALDSESLLRLEQKIVDFL